MPSLTSKEVVHPAQHLTVVTFPLVGRSHILVSFRESHFLAVPNVRLAA